MQNLLHTFLYNRSILSKVKLQGVLCGSITHLATRLRDLEGKTDQSATFDLAEQLSKKLAKLNSELKVHHLALNLIDDEEILDKEQDILDEHDESSILADCIEQLIKSCNF